ncbi:MAG: trimeric autotransporter adhesin, partial [Thermoleophilaceae bacterium]|nr:trimeric autotransporter adhesin [Thermoleophilaceae bacterium]
MRGCAVLCLGVLACALGFAPGPAMASDVPLSPGYGVNGAVNAVAYDSSGRTYLGGNFTEVGPAIAGGAKLTTTSDAPDLGFPDVLGTLSVVASDGAGGWFIGGQFTAVGGVARSNIAHILSSGAVDATWNPNADNAVSVLAVSGSDVYVAGSFTSIGGQARNSVAKLSASGTGAADATWNPSPNGQVLALAVSGSDVFAGGQFTSIGGQSRVFIAKLSTGGTGAADPFWNPSAFDSVSALAVSGSDLYAGGQFIGIGGQSRNHIAKLSTAGTGAADPTWDPNANGTVSGLAVSGSDVYATGNFSSIGGQPRFSIAKLSASGTGAADATWNPNADNAVSVLAVSGSDVYVGGDFTSIGGQARNRVAKLSTGGTGAADATWNPDPNSTVSALAVSGSGVYVGGSFTSIGRRVRTYIARLLPDGTLDATWNPHANNLVYALAVSGSDVYVGGSFTSIGGQARDRVAKLSTGGTGTADVTWNPGAGDIVRALAVSGSDVYAGGDFTTLGGQTRNRIAKLLPDGTLDATWDPNASGPVSALALSGPDVYVGGSFTSIGGQTRNRVAKLSTVGTGTADATWNPNADNAVYALAVSGSGVYAGGSFSSIGGQARTRLAKLSSGGTGTADAAWNPNANSTVSALAASGAPARLAVGGAFTTIGVQSRLAFASFDIASTAAISAAPSSLAFGSRSIGAGPTATQTVTITNTGTDDVTLGTPSIGGTDATDFAFASPTVPADCKNGDVIAPTHTCDVRVKFDPSFSGAKSAQVTVPSDAPTAPTVALSGTGTAPILSRSPGTLTFARDVDDGASGAQTSVVTNTGSEPVPISSVTIGGPDAGDFTQLTNLSSDCTNQTLAVNDTCDIRVYFDPTTTGSKTATVTVGSSAPNISVTLNGDAQQTLLTRSPATVAFGNREIAGGPSSVQSSTVTNSGTQPVTISAVTPSGDSGDFTQQTDAGTDCVPTKVLGAGQTCDLRYVFDPTTVGAKLATVTVSSNADDVSVDLTGTGIRTELSAAPTSLAFGSKDIDEGATAAQTSTITNTGEQTVNVSSVTKVGTDPGEFTRLTGNPDDCGANNPLAPGATCKVRVAFDPSSFGAKSATVRVNSNAPATDIGVTGTGIQTEISASPTTIAFGKQDIDDSSTAAHSSTVTNTGSEPVTLTGISTTGGDAADFTMEPFAAGDCTDSTSLNAGQTCKLRYTFDPATTGSKSATVTLTSNADDLAVGLTGQGTQTLVSRTPATRSFGNQEIDGGATAPQQVVVTNDGTEDVTIATVSSDDPNFAQTSGGAGIQDCAAATVLHAGNTCRVQVVFNPSTTGAKSGTVSVTSNANTISFAVDGTGIQTELSRSPASLTFGSRELDAGPTSPQESVVTNSGTEPVTISSVAISGSQRGQFQRLTDQPATDCAAATVLTAGQTCKVRVQFDPSWEGAKSATVTVASNADPVTIALNGTGTRTTFARSDVPLDSFEFDGAVNAVAFDSAGRTYVGGAFSSIGHRTGRGVKLTSADDQPNPAFPDVDGPINAVAADGSGGWFIGGSFATVGGVARPNLAHILSSGAVDPSFNPQPDSTVNALVRSGTQLYVGGDFSHMSGQSSIRLAEITASNGALDTNWTPDPNNTVTAITVSGADVYVGGNFTVIG